VTAELQIGTDPTNWYLPTAEYDTVAAALARPDTPIAVDVLAPLEGRLVLSPRAAGTVVLTIPIDPVGWVPSGIVKPTRPVVYLPSTTGPTAGHPGLTLAADTDLAALEQQLTAAMTGPGSTLALTLEVPAPGRGMLLLSGATLAYAVLCRAAAAG
jgi:hypothetical protein